MKKYLFAVASALLSAGALQAQMPQWPGRHQPFDLSGPGRLKRPGQPLEQPRRQSTARKAGKVTTYFWESAANQWSATPIVSEHTYDGKGNPTLTVELDSATRQPQVRSSYTYTAAGQNASETRELWNGSAWENSSRQLTTYNSAGARTESLSQQWQNGAWQNTGRTVLEYDAYGHITLAISQQWQNNAWLTTDGEQTTRRYNAAGAVLEETQDEWRSSAGAFVPSLRYQYTYPTASAREYSGQTTQAWDAINGVYYDFVRTGSIVRDTQGRHLSEVRERWDGQNWLLYWRYQTTYQANGTSQMIAQSHLSNAWVNERRYTLPYDDFGNALGYTDEQWRNNAWAVASGGRNLLRYDANHEVLADVYQYYDAVASRYVNGVRFIYGEFRDIALPTAKPAQALASQLQLYPNPTSGNVSLALSGLAGLQPVSAELVNSLGQTVRRLTLPVAQGQLRAELDVSQLRAGVYSLRLHTAAGLVVQRLVRE